jgi:hypothetical protein
MPVMKGRPHLAFNMVTTLDVRFDPIREAAS